ncbi:MAG TPA: glycosyltransferase family 2 protein [Gammaproteobacteria bacterium]|nr:glycosyltransferase family 2 protein [Gammaproteobacteria bacterium]
MKTADLPASRAASIGGRPAELSAPPAENPSAGAQPKSVDILIPAYNEEHNIGPLIEQLFATLRDSRYRIEIIVVDDGSEDGTAEVVREHCGRYPVTLLSLARNFGKETALLAGLDYSSADAVVVMDADWQHPVELIPRFFEEWEAGYRCVYAVKQHRRDEGLAKALLVKLFYLIVNYDSKFRIEPDAVDFRLLDRSVVTALRSVRERVRFMKGLYAWVGFRSKAIPFEPDPRREGKSKFSARSLLRLGWDGLTSFSDLPLRLSAVTGFLISLGSLIYGAYIWIRTLAFGVDEPGWATLVVAITFLSGVQMLFLGILGQYIRNIFLETKNRPSYVLAEVVTQSQAAEHAPEPPVLGDARAELRPVQSARGGRFPA